MPGKLTFHKTDPQHLGRGSGTYYHRGKGIYSKYSEHRDMMIKAKHWQVHVIGLPKTSTIKQAGDGRFS